MVGYRFWRSSGPPKECHGFGTGHGGIGRKSGGRSTVGNPLFHGPFHGFGVIVVKMHVAEPGHLGTVFCIGLRIGHGNGLPICGVIPHQKAEFVPIVALVHIHDQIGRDGVAVEVGELEHPGHLHTYRTGGWPLVGVGISHMGVVVIQLPALLQSQIFAARVGVDADAGACRPGWDGKGPGKDEGKCEQQRQKPP